MRTLFTAVLLFSTGALSAQECDRVPQPPFNSGSYYSAAAGLEGDALKAALSDIIDGHEVYSYTPCVWAILMEADEDPANADNVVGIYTRRSIPKANRDTGSSSPDFWSRGHLWSTSHGFREDSDTAHTDVHHIVAADKSVNTDRSDNDFLEGGTPDDECTACRDGDGTWEPPDDVKGQIARAMLYMAVRYEGQDDTGDLELVDEATAPDQIRFGFLSELLDWHCHHPVTARERARHEVVYSWQGNRNPFIDRPEFAESVWGGECERVGAEMQALLERLEAVESAVAAIRAAIEAMQ